MKKRYLYLLVFSFAVFAVACKKNNNDTTPQTELSKLPPATQTGANTFGALVNGQAFLPYTRPFTNASPYQCNYIYTNGGYYLIVDGTVQVNSGYDDMVIGTTLLPIKEGQTLALETYNQSGKAFGLYGLINGNTVTYQTTTTVSGQMYISHFDQVKQIVSGTFFFNAINSTGDTVHVTNGRFDMIYTT